MFAHSEPVSFSTHVSVSCSCDVSSSGLLATSRARISKHAEGIILTAVSETARAQSPDPEAPTGRELRVYCGTLHNR